MKILKEPLSSFVRRLWLSEEGKLPKTPISKSADDMTKITAEKVKTVVQNMDLSNEELSEMTDGLSLPVIRTIKVVTYKGLRGRQG